jgi:hypothetical protein
MTSGFVGLASAAVTAGKAIWSAFFGTAGRDAVVKFADTFGGFDALHKQLDALGKAGEGMWVKLTQQTGRNDLKAAQDTIAQINQLLQGQTDYLNRLPGEMQKYGLSWEQAGHEAEQAHLDEIAKGLIQDFADLTKAGFDITTVTGAMSSAINDYIHEALRTGDEVPAAMKPLLQKMVDMGTLTDNAGKQITDLSTSGLTFSETLTEGFKSIVDAINQLTKALTGNDPSSLKNSLTEVGGMEVHPHIKPIIDTPTVPPGYGGAASGAYVTRTGLHPIYRDLGGFVGGYTPRGTDTIPAMLTPGEIVLNAAQQKQIARAITSGPTFEIQISIDRPIVKDRQAIVELSQEIGRQLKSSWSQMGTW